jgi:hypothetical protein
LATRPGPFLPIAACGRLITGMGLSSAFILGALAASVLVARADPAPPVPSRAESFAMIDAGDFAKLEKITGRLREARTGFYNGWPPLHTFYNQLSFSTPDDSVWQRYIGSFSRWQDAFPESPTPRIALANLYREYAWQARGSGWSNSVTEEGARLFGERLATAQGILEEARSLKTRDAEACFCLLIVARGLGLPRSVVDDALNEGLSINPDYTPLYAAEATYLLPRWCGQPGDWEAFASQAADKRGGDDGDLLYMFIVRSVAFAEGANLFKNTNASYPRMKKGFLVSRSRYPKNAWELNSFCYFASIAGDAPTATALFKQIGDHYEGEVWGNAKDFDFWRDRFGGAPPAEPPRPDSREPVNIAIGSLVVLLGFGVFVLLRRARAA